MITFGSYFLHQRDMRSLVGIRDERGVQSAAAALSSELHHRASNISNLVVLAELSGDTDAVKTTPDLASDFRGGLAYLGKDGQVLSATKDRGLWTAALKNNVTLASQSSGSEPVFSQPFQDPGSRQAFVIVSAYSAARNMIVAGAFSPEDLAQKVLSPSYPAGDRTAIYLLDPSRRILYGSPSASGAPISADHPGLTEALRGETGTRYVKVGDSEHVVAYSPVAPTGWALLTCAHRLRA